MNSLLSSILLVLAAWLPALAQAADFPTQPVRIVVPFGPGGGTDLAARAIAEQLTASLGKPVLVENRPGGNSVIASRIVATAPADGHTLLLTTDIHAINAAYAPQLPYDSLKDFAFVAQLTTSPLMLVANPSTGIRSVPELVRRAKAEPGRLSFASLGPSSPHYLAFEWFKRMAGIDVVDVPYKGGGQALADTLGGQVDLSLVVAGNGIRQARAGKLLAVAVTSGQRTPIAPEVPSIAESGYPEFAIVNWYAILAPAGTPPAIVERLNAEIRRALNDKGVVERLVGAGLEPATGSPAELEALVRRDIDRYRRIIELTGAKLQ
ncbi:MAG: tripartite tricarboxylate transporter substrate binding protein [Burkholderiaceae bacterium]|nr:tripartite tricarboxylate transporter substrate binding protein [Burkholderiaceae bacterium]